MFSLVRCWRSVVIVASAWRVRASSSDALLALWTVLVLLLWFSIIIAPLLVVEKALYDDAAPAGLNAPDADKTSLLLAVVDAEIMLL